MIIKFNTENERHEQIELCKSSNKVGVVGLEISIGDGDYGQFVFLSVESVREMIESIKMLLKEEK